MKHDDPLSFQSWLKRNRENKHALLDVIREAELPSDYGLSVVYELLEARGEVVPQFYTAQTSWAQYQEDLAASGTLRAWLLSPKANLRNRNLEFSDLIREDPSFPDSTYTEARIWTMEHHPDYRDELAAVWTLFRLDELRRSSGNGDDTFSSPFTSVHSSFDEVLAVGPSLPHFWEGALSRAINGFAVHAGGTKSPHAFFLQDLDAAQQTARLLSSASGISTVGINEAVDLTVHNGSDQHTLIVSSTTIDRNLAEQGQNH